MADVLKYNGYQGSVEFDLEENMLQGQVLHIQGSVMYEATTLAELKERFQEAVDLYLDMCQREGVTPEKPYNGTFNVRIGPDRHQALARLASREGVSLNDLMGRAVDAYLEVSPPSPPAEHHHHHYHVIPLSTTEQLEQPIHLKAGGLRSEVAVWPARSN